MRKIIVPIGVPIPPMVNKLGRLKISAARKRDRQRTMKSMSFPVPLQRARESYFSLSSFVIVLYPAIRNAPLPHNRMMARIKKIAIIQIKIIMFLY